MRFGVQTFPVDARVTRRLDGMSIEVVPAGNVAELAGNTRFDESAAFVPKK